MAPNRPKSRQGRANDDSYQTVHPPAPKRIPAPPDSSSLQQAQHPMALSAANGNNMAGTTSSWVNSAVPNISNRLSFVGDRSGRQDRRAGRDCRHSTTTTTQDPRSADVPQTTGMTVGRLARLMSQQWPALPPMPAIPYLNEGSSSNDNSSRRGSANTPGYSQVLPRSKNSPSNGSDDSTGTSVNEPFQEDDHRQPHDRIADQPRRQQQQYGSNHRYQHRRRRRSEEEDDDSFFLVHNADEVAADNTYDPRKWHDRPIPHSERAKQMLGKGARRARETAVRAGETAVVAGGAAMEVAVEAARVGVEVARVGVQVGGTMVMTNGRDLMTDLVREARVLSPRNRLQFHEIDQDVGGGYGSGEEKEELEDPQYSDDDADQSSEHSDEEEEGNEEIVTDGLRVTGEPQEQIGSCFNQAQRTSSQKPSADEISDSDEHEFFDAPEGATVNTVNTPAGRASYTFSDIDLSSPEREKSPEGYDEISTEEGRRAHYALEDLGPHTRRRLRASQPNRGFRRLARMDTRRPAAARRPPSPYSSHIAMLSEMPEQLPRSRRQAPDA